MAKVALIGDIKADSSNIVVGVKLKRLLASMDYVIANLEGPIVTNAEPRPDKVRPLCSSPAIAPLLKDLNVKVVTLANNHIMDYGVEGLRETIEFLDSHGVLWIGAEDGNSKCSHVMRLPDVGIALMAYAHNEGPMSCGPGRGIGPYRLPGIHELVSTIKNENEAGFSVFLSYHGGEEFHQVPWPRRLGWAAALAEAGADVVYGHHSHSIQPVYRLPSGSILAPGLGNFYFDTPHQRRRRGTNKGIILIVDTTGHRVDLVRVRADWEEEALEIEETGPVLSCRKLDSNELCSDWASECQQRIFRGGLNTVSQPGDWWKRYARAVRFVLRQTVSRYRNVRDCDVIFSSVPRFGQWYARKIFDRGKTEFYF